MKFKRSVILLASIFMLFSGCRKHNPENEEAINVVNKNLNKINNYITDYSVKEGDDLIFIGKITFIKPNTTRVEIVSSQNKKFKTIIYSNGNLKYMYFPQSNQAIKEKLVKRTNEKYNFVYQGVINGEEILSLVYSGRIRIKGDDFFEFRATMGSKDKGTPVNVYTFFFDVKTGCVKKFFYNDDKTGKKVIHEFENYKINIPINKREVELNLPSDARITQIN